MSQTKRVRVPLSDKTGYDREVVVKKTYLVKWDGNPPSTANRSFTDYDDAVDLFSQHLEENPKVEEVVMAIQIKTVLPKRSTFSKPVV